MIGPEFHGSNSRIIDQIAKGLVNGKGCGHPGPAVIKSNDTILLETVETVFATEAQRC
jgi:hypothetical protein